MKLQEIINNIKHIDKKIMKIVKNSIKISFIVCLISIFILVTYLTVGETYTYYIGIALFKSGLFYIVGSIICGVAFNSIMNDI